MRRIEDRSPGAYGNARHALENAVVRSVIQKAHHRRTWGVSVRLFLRNVKRMQNEQHSERTIDTFGFLLPRTRSSMIAVHLAFLLLFFSFHIYIYIYIFVTPLGDSRDLSIPRASDKRIRLPHIRICSWNIHSRGYQRAVARMSLQRSPVIALVCFSGRWQRLNVSNTGNPLRRTYFAHATRAQAFVATAIYANRIRLPYSATQERTTTRSAAICCQLNPRDALNLRNKLFLLSRLLRSLPSTFLPTCRSHVVECAVEMRFA